MSNQSYPSVNGIAPSWSDVEISFTPDGAAILESEDIAGIKSAPKLDIGTQKGTSGGRPKKRTTGAVEYEASITLYREGYQKLLRALMAKAPTRGNQVRISLVPFEILVQFTPFGSDEIFTRRIKGCRIAGGSMDHKEGSDADQVEVPLSTIEVADVIDGKEVVLI